jgi:hypothetical protein
MKYQDYMDRVEQATADIAGWYGDFGIELTPVWGEDAVDDFIITWPQVEDSHLADAYSFAEALGAAAFEAAKLTGITVEYD